MATDREIAQAVRVKQLVRTHKRDLAKLYKRITGTLNNLSEINRWTKDELISGIIEMEFPQGPVSDETRDEMVQLADQLGAPHGLSGLAWLRQLAEMTAGNPAPAPTDSDKAGCVDCGAGAGEPHTKTCFYYGEARK